jgi:hypothetical protein
MAIYGVFALGHCFALSFIVGGAGDGVLGDRPDAVNRQAKGLQRVRRHQQAPTNSFHNSLILGYTRMFSALVLGHWRVERWLGHPGRRLPGRLPLKYAGIQLYVCIYTYSGTYGDGLESLSKE